MAEMGAGRTKPRDPHQYVMHVFPNTADVYRELK